MKKTLLSMLAFAAMTSCANQEMPENQVDSNLVPINLLAGVEAVTRAGDGPISSGTFTFGVAGWEDATGTPTYTADPTWATTATGTAAAVDGKITWGTKQYYNAADATKTYLFAWYPAGTIAAGAVALTDKDGLVDVMIANKVSGSRTSAAAALKFEHKTTQFVFNVEKGASLAAGVKLKSIKINGAAVPSSIDIAAGTVTYEAAAAFSVPNITEAEIGANAQAGNAVMLKPFDSKTFSVDVETTAGTFTGITVTCAGDGNFEEGTAYTITLTFNQKIIDSESSVSAWKTGTGTGTVQ